MWYVYVFLCVLVFICVSLMCVCLCLCVCVLSSLQSGAPAGAAGPGASAVQAGPEGGVDPQREAGRAEGGPAEPAARTHPHPPALHQTAQRAGDLGPPPTHTHTHTLLCHFFLFTYHRMSPFLDHLYKVFFFPVLVHFRASVFFRVVNR